MPGKYRKLFIAAAFSTTMLTGLVASPTTSSAISVDEIRALISRLGEIAQSLQTFLDENARTAPPADTSNDQAQNQSGDQTSSSGHSRRHKGHRRQRQQDAQKVQTPPAAADNGPGETDNGSDSNLTLTRKCSTATSAQTKAFKAAAVTQGGLSKEQADNLDTSCDQATVTVPIPKAEGGTFRMIDMTLGQGDPEAARAVAALGYNIIDASGSYPPGVQGSAYIPNCDFSDHNQEIIRSNAGNAGLWGFYISDEPSPDKCPPENMRQLVNLIHNVAPGAFTFTVLGDYEGSGEYASILDYVGIDPYPAQTTGFHLNLIQERVEKYASNGVPKSKMGPVFQAFGGGEWVMPSADQFRQILAEWQRVLPNPPIEDTYVWAWSGGDGLREHPEIQELVKAHNTGG